MLSLLGLASSVGFIFAVLLVGGLGSAAYHPIGAAFARSAGGGRPSGAVSIFGAGGTAGMGIGPIIAVTFVASFGLGSTPWLMLPGLAIAALLWLVSFRGVPRDAALSGWTLAALSTRFSRRSIVVTSMLLAPLPLFAIFQLEPGSLGYFTAVVTAGALAHAGLPGYLAIVLGAVLAAAVLDKTRTQTTALEEDHALAAGGCNGGAA